MTPALLIAGIGNIFLGDDAFGVEVVRRLSSHKLPDSVRVVDFGIRGLDLAYALLDSYDVTILVDATPQGGVPGTLYVIEPDLGVLHNPQAPDLLIETHGMDPMRVLGLVKAMGGQLQRILVVGCEPATLGPEEGLMGLSEPVQTAVDEAVGLIESLMRDILAQDGSNATRCADQRHTIRSSVAMDNRQRIQDNNA